MVLMKIHEFLISMTKNISIDISKYKKALDFSFNFYKNKSRRGFKTPYFTYLSSVSNLIIENNGSTDEAIAGLLHDAYEFENNNNAVSQISKRFGVKVSNIVKQCSNFIEVNIDKEKWIEEKKKFLDTMQKKSQSSLFVSLCDKFYGLSCLINDHNRIGRKIWKHYPVEPVNLIWYHKNLCKNFKKHLKNHKNLKDKFQRHVNELDYLLKK